MKKRAFTLIELAIVLTIVGVVIGGSFKLLKSNREKAYINQAKEQVSVAKNAVIGYAMQYIDLPTWGEFASELSPLKTKVTDLNRTFFYFADRSLDKDIDICAYQSTNLVVDFYTNNSTFDHNISNVAFVVAAQSVNHNIQTDFSTAAGVDTIKIYDATSDNVDDNSRDFTRTEDADDIVEYVTLSELQQQIDCKSNRLKILNDSEIVGNNTTIYNPEIYATKGTPLTSGTGNYKWCIEGNPSLRYDCPSGTSLPFVGLCTPSSFHQCDFIKINNISSYGNYNISVHVQDESTQSISKNLLIKITP